ncbi:5247_t:CDS:2 [Funneliformis geosporum]|uniref:12578_t:CDS:1 n=1 Tax=Funneliformis geosporum TaxID=1117311 RepID=A0A9W4SNV8_9GLOM|nr:5247_t:CDS:2 [Funneliformis geosporum]CAI2176003.1 12578_t:CDS:2 [Funneliformis geosporum]
MSPSIPVKSKEHNEITRVNDDNGRVMNWDEVKEIVGCRLELLRREKSLQLKYAAYKVKIAQEYNSLDHYVCKVILNWPKEIIVHQKSFSNNLSPQEYFSSKTPSTHYNLRLNDFPYIVDASISHYILWSKLPFEDQNDPDVRKEIDSFLKEKFPGEKEWVFFINPPRLQSVKSIWHGHIFVRDVPNNISE